jgi:hypothetical protein
MPSNLKAFGKSTYNDRANTNRKVCQTASAIANLRNLQKNDIKPFSTYTNSKQEALLKRIVRTDHSDPLRQATLTYNDCTPYHVNERRVGRPRLNWTHETYKRLFINHGYGTVDDWKSNHIDAIRSMEDDTRAKRI